MLNSGVYKFEIIDDYTVKITSTLSSPPTNKPLGRYSQRSELLKLWHAIKNDERYEVNDECVFKAEQGDSISTMMLVIKPHFLGDKRIKPIAQYFPQYMREDPLESKVVTISGMTYRIGDKIGQGSYGLVFKAYDTNTNQLRAIKIIDVPEDREGENIEKLIGYHHPGVVDYIAHQRIHGKSWIVMQYINGELLGKYEKGHGEIRHTATYKEQEREILTYLENRG